MGITHKKILSSINTNDDKKLILENKFISYSNEEALNNLKELLIENEPEVLRIIYEYIK